MVAMEKSPVLKAAAIVGSVFLLLLLLASYGFLVLICLLFLPVRVYFAAHVGYLFVIAFWLLFFFKGKAARRILTISGLSLVLVTALSIGATFAYEGYLNSIALVDNSNIDTRKYLPFDEESKIARLDEPSTLRFTMADKLPRVDGAAALFPMYSSFVNAVYPQNIPALNREDGCFFFTNTISSCAALYAGRRDLIFGVDPGPYAPIGRSSDELTITPIGREGFVFFTNVQNKVDSLTIEELRGIYSGRITNWSEVGGDNVEIRPYQRNPGSGSQQGILDFMGEEKLVTPPSDNYVFSLMSGIIRAISNYHNHPGAIGYSYHYYASQLMADNNIKLLRVNDIAPSKQTIGSNEYPLTHDFYASSRKNDANPNTQKLLDWVLSGQGQELVDKSGYAKIG